MVVAGGAIYVADAMPAELVTISRVMVPPCTFGPDGYRPPSLTLHRAFEIDECTPMRLATGPALFVELRIGEENDIAVYGEDGHEIVAPTPVPFDPYPHADVASAPYEVADVDGDGVDEIIMQNEGWIRALAVRDHDLVVTAEHSVLGSARSTARRALAHDTLVPLRVATPPVQEVAVCGELTFVLSRPMPISQIVTTYTTKTGELRLGPRQIQPVRRLGCALTIEHSGNAAMPPYDHLEVAPGAHSPWPDWRTE